MAGTIRLLILFADGSLGTVKNVMAISLETVLFCKSVACPSSGTLLAYRQFRLLWSERSHISIHLATCDFCSAELQLLARHSEDREEYVLPDMPAELRILAEQLLGNSKRPRTTFEFFHA